MANVTVLSPEFKQITLPQAVGEDNDTGITGRGKDEKPNANENRGRTTAHGSVVVRFDPDTRTAYVSQEVADELVRLFPQSVVVLPSAGE